MRVFVTTLTAGEKLSINIETFHSIEYLKQLIYEQTDKGDGMVEIRLTLAGRQLENRYTLAEYHIAPDETVDADEHESGDFVIPVFVKTLQPKIFTVYVKTSHTVEHLKQQMSYIDVMPPDQQQLIFGRVQLENEKRLSDYNIQKNDTISLLKRLGSGRRSAPCFLFTSVAEPFEIHQPSPTDPSYRQFCNGVSSEGVCVNPKCIAYAKRFVCQHGYGVYRVREHATICPECQGGSHRVESFGFSRANVIIRAVPLFFTTQQPDIRSDLSEADGDYKFLPYFAFHAANGMREYNFIEVLSCTPDSSITWGKELCSACSRTIEGSNGCRHCHRFSTSLSFDGANSASTHALRGILNSAPRRLRLL